MRPSTKLCARIGFLCLLAILDGMVDSCMGPALRDLQCIFNVTLQEVSLFQPVITAGGVIGSLLFLKIPGCVNVYGVAAATMSMASCLLAAIPVLPSFWMALGLSGAVGLAHGSAMHARILLSGELSKQHVATIHITYLATALGCITGPLIISPFLSDSVGESNNGQAFHHGNMTFLLRNRTGTAVRDGNMTCTSQNSTEPAFHQGSMTFAAKNSTAQSKDNLCYNLYSDLIYGFFLIALFGVFVFLAYVFAHRVFQDDLYINQPNEMRSTISLSDGVFLFIFTVHTLTCGSMIFVYGHFLPAFGIYCSLHSDTRQMATMSLSLHVCVMFGRLFGTLSSLAVAQTVLINVCTTLGIIVSVMLIYVSELDTTWLWIGTSILAFVSSPVVSALDTWALDVNRHRRIQYGISSIVDMAGYSVMSLLTGQLMAYFLYKC